MPTDTETGAAEPAPQNAEPAVDDAIAASKTERLPFPPRLRRVHVKTPRMLRKPLRAIDRTVIRTIERLAVTPERRRRTAIIGALAINAAMLAVLAVYGRVLIFVPNKPAESISVIYVDLPASPPAIDLRDPEIAPEPEPEPVVEPEITPEPEPAPVPEPTPKPEPPAPNPKPAPEPEREPEPVIDLTPEPAFARPSEIEEAPFIPDEAPPPPEPTLEELRPGDIVVEGEQAPAEDAPPLVTVEPETRQAEAESDAGDDDKKEQDEGAGEVAAGEAELTEQAPVAAATPTSAEEPATGDDMFDQEPVFGARQFTLPQVELPKGETSAVPGTSGVVAIYCPDEFKDKEKIAECAGRPEIRSGWRPGSSGEDFSKAAAVLKDRNKHGDFSNDATTFGPEIARQIEQRRKIEDLEDFRRNQDGIENAGIAPDLATGTRPNIGPDAINPSWTRRDDPLVDQKDVEKLRKELEEAEKKKSPQ